MISISIDPVSLASFRAALGEYMQVCKRDVVEIVNRRALNLAFRAAQFTPTADRNAVAQLVGVRNPYALAVWNLKRAGKKIPKRHQMEKVVSRLISARVRTVGFIRGGWVKAGRRVAELVRIRAPRIGSLRGPGKGDAVVADILNLTAEIINRSVSKSPTSVAALRRYGGQGLNAALAFEARDMREYIARKLKQRADEFNRR